MTKLLSLIEELDKLDRLIEDGTLHVTDTLITLRYTDTVWYTLTVGGMLTLRRAALAGTALAKTVKKMDFEGNQIFDAWLGRAGSSTSFYLSGREMEVRDGINYKWRTQRDAALKAYRQAIDEKNV